MLGLIISLIIGLIIGYRYHQRKSRVQCVNCGSHNTKYGASGYGSVKGSKAKFAVKHWEGHTCEECGKTTSIKMLL